MIYTFITPYKPREMFLSEIPKALLSDLTEAINNSYEEAYEYCWGNFDKHQAHDLLPHYRKAAIERNISFRMRRYPKAKVHSLPNSVQNCYHILLRYGNLALTISAVKNPGEMVRYAIFRNQYAREAQMSIFTEVNSAPVLNQNLYGILLHGTNDKLPERPSFLLIRFPDMNLSKYLDHPIDLLNIQHISQEENIATPNVAARKIHKEDDLT